MSEFLSELFLIGKDSRELRPPDPETDNDE